MTQYLPEGQPDPIPDWMTQETPMTEQQTIERDFNVAEMKARTRMLIVGALFLAFVLVFCVREAKAQTTCPTTTTLTCAWNEDCLDWIRPTTYVDGTTLDPASIASYAVEAAPIGSSTWAQVSSVTAPTQAYKRTGLKAGDAFQYRISAVLKSGARSDPSNICNLTTTEPKPNAPVLRVSEPTAFEIYPSSTGALVAHQVGVVPPGAQCFGDQSLTVAGVTYTQVPRDLLDLDRASTAADKWVSKVYAKCGA